MRNAWIVLAIILWTSAGFGQQMIEKTLAGSSTAQNPADARREIQDEVAGKLTEELALELLGEERFRKNQSVIKGKIAKSSGRYIPFLKTGKLQRTSDGFSMSVTMKANLSSLRQVLQEAGLLNENTTSPLLLPAVTFVDRVNLRSERWWLAEDRAGGPFLRTMQRRFETAARKHFRKGGFHVLKPQGMQLTRALPSGLRSENPGPEDMQLMGDWFGAPLIIGGTVAVLQDSNGRGPRIDVKLDVFQTSNYRPIADVSRSYTTDRGTFEGVVEKKWNEVVDALMVDLASQVTEAWQKGSVGSSQMRLVMEPRPALPDIEKLKERLKSSSAGIRSVRERLISAQSLILEVESPVPAEDLARRLQGFEFNGRRFETSVQDEKAVRIRWSGGGSK